MKSYMKSKTTLVTTFVLTGILTLLLIGSSLYIAQGIVDSVLDKGLKNIIHDVWEGGR